MASILSPSIELDNDSLELVTFLGPHNSTAHPRYPETSLHGNDLSLNSSRSHPSSPHLEPLGIPSRKKMLYYKDILTVLLSFLCLAAAITVVANESLSWSLGVGTRQLILLGFFLSIMNLCLSSITPVLFLHFEARFGPSTLPNYDGILRSQIFASKLSLVWRLVLFPILLVPLALSAAYKTFSGGESSKVIDATAYLKNASFYGMFGPPGMQSYGRNTGLTLFSNATVPFMVASTSQVGEPAIPVLPRAYGYNILLLGNDTSAVLDTLQPDYVTSIQNKLAPGESWIISAPIIGTVATYNYSKIEDPKNFNTTFLDSCAAAKASSGAIQGMSMFDASGLVLVDHASPGDQSYQYLALVQDSDGDWQNNKCSVIVGRAERFTVTRKSCKAAWSLTRNSLQLINGTCATNDLDEQKQLIITDNIMFLPNFFLPSLVEFMGIFSTTRNQSDWKFPYLATGVAAMVWSRVTAMNGAANLDQSHAAPIFKYARDNISYYPSYRDVGLVYPVNDTVEYVRPTLRKSGWLYLVLAIQPVMAAVSLLLIATLHSTPVDRGFGMVSILSGLDRTTLDHLSGAGLSGSLAKEVKLLILPLDKGDKAMVEYGFAPVPTETSNGSLKHRSVYH